MLTTVELWDDAALTALLAGANLLGAAMKAGLMINTPPVSKSLVLADLTEPAYAGYARQLVVMGVPYRDPSRGITAQAAALHWAMANALLPTIITGIFYTYGAGPLLLGVEMFPTPLPLTDALSTITTVLQYVQSPPAVSLTTIVG